MLEYLNFCDLVTTSAVGVLNPRLLSAMRSAIDSFIHAEVRRVQFV
jgi:hypothetical protein